jgi:hypothetical protein
MSRRRVLQAGLATGVAAAAVWSTPKIVAAGTTPTNGQVCTVPTVKFFSDDKKNLDCESSCVQAGLKYLTYKEPYNGDGFTIDFLPRADGLPEGCSAPLGAPYSISFDKATDPGPGFTCFIGKFTVFNEPSGITKTVDGGGIGGVAPPLRTLDLGNCAWFYGDVEIECCPNGNLHPA